MVFTDPARLAYLLMTFVQGGVTYRLTDWTEELTYDGQVYDPWPALQVKIPPNTGTLGEKSLTVEFPVGRDAVFDSWVDGTPQAPVTVGVREITVSQGPIDSAGCAKGQAISFGSAWRLMRGAKSRASSATVSALEFHSIKSRLAIPMGIAAYPRCAWTFGDGNCGLDVDALEETATVDGVARKRILLTDPDDSAVVIGKSPARYWHRGSVTKGGLTLSIRDWQADSYEIELVREPPASWLGAAVTLRPGCVKAIGASPSTGNDCRGWANEERFGGFGAAIPAYDPGGEVP
jgi:hypothetical protein